MDNTQKHFTDEEEQLYSEVEKSMMNYLSEKELKQIEEYLSQFTEEQLENPTEEMEENSKKISNWSAQSAMKMVNDLLSKKVVWFTIGGAYGKYYITMFYENGYNEADGSDL